MDHNTKKWPILSNLILASLILAGLATFEGARAAELEIAIHGLSEPQKLSVPDSVMAQASQINQEKISSRIVKPEAQVMSQYLNNRQNQSLSNQEKKALVDVSNFINAQVLTKIENQAPINAAWEEKDGTVTTFEPGTPGQYYQPLALIKNLAQAANKNESVVNFEPTIIQPDLSLAEVNNYGITDLIASGNSNFAGSSRNRVQNIRVASARYQGYIIKPDQVFSFNDQLGEVDGEHGFAPEMVIKHNGVVPEFGGGVCQVSTTVFRTVLNAGLPVVERRNHSFAVAYYAPQGTDATTYTGVIDLKFKNDTGHPILMWSEINGTIITFNFYGHSDGRKVELASPVRYDAKPDGSFKTSLARKVVYADGQIKDDIFRSHYRPRAEFIQTTTAQEPVNPNPAPLPTPAPTEPTAPTNT